MVLGGSVPQSLCSPGKASIAYGIGYPERADDLSMGVTDTAICNRPTKQEQRPVIRMDAAM